MFSKLCKYCLQMGQTVYTNFFQFLPLNFPGICTAFFFFNNCIYNLIFSFKSSSKSTKSLFPADWPPFYSSLSWPNLYLGQLQQVSFWYVPSLFSCFSLLYIHSLQLIVGLIFLQFTLKKRYIHVRMPQTSKCCPSCLFFFFNGQF